MTHCGVLVDSLSVALGTGDGALGAEGIAIEGALEKMHDLIGAIFGPF